MTDHVHEFWAHFAATVWGKTPAVLRPPFDAALGTPEEVFKAATEAARRYASPNLPPRVRAYLGATEQRDAAPFLPDPADVSLDGYLRRVRQVPGDDGFGVMVNQFQSTDDVIWNRVTRFLGGLQRAVGAAIGGSHLDLFVVNQRCGFIGVHKDSQDVFTTVVSGRKRMLLWPFERLRDRTGQGELLRLRGWKLGQICDDALRVEAIVLDAEPGDIMYWPADYWHNSEADGEPVVTMALGVVRTADPSRFAQMATDALVRQQTTPGPAAPDLSLAGFEGAMNWLDAAIADAFADPRYRDQLENTFLRWLTACGFEEVPGLARASELRDETWLSGCGAPMFVHHSRRGALAIWSHGHALELPGHPALLRLCDEIQRKDCFRVGAFLDEAVANEPPDRRDATRRKLAALLTLLVRARALAPTEPAPVPVEHATAQSTLDDRYSAGTLAAPAES